MLSFLRKVFNSKWNFKKPHKKRILIYDGQSKVSAYFIFSKTECSIMYVRYEEINFFVLFKTILKSGLINIRDNYKYNYITIVDPEIIFTAFTWNYAFFKLKNKYPKALYICMHGSNSDISFFEECDKYYQTKNNVKLKADLIFVAGKYYENKFSKYIDAKIFSIGSFKNNLFYLKKKKDIIETDSILFISQIKALSEKEITLKYKLKIDNEIRIVKTLNSYCKRNNYTLKIAAKSTEDKIDFYKRKFGDGKWTIFPLRGWHTSYDLVNDSSLVVFTNSTLGLEALVKGIRCVAFPPEEFPVENHGKRFSKKGPFWSEKFDEKILEHYLQKIRQYSDDEWRRIVNDNIGDLFEYDPQNTKFIQVMDNLKIKTLIN